MPSKHKQTAATLNMKNETVLRIHAQLDRLERERRDDPSTQSHREAWLVVGFRPDRFDTWVHDDGRRVTYMQVLTMLPDGEGA